MKNENMIQSGLDILRREARETRAHGCEKDRKYNEIMQAAERQVNAYGGDWPAIREAFSREIAELLKM